MQVKSGREPRGLKTFHGCLVGSVCLLIIGCCVGAAEGDPVAPPNPADKNQPVKPATKESRPRIKYWLDEPVTKAGAKESEAPKIPEPVDANAETAEKYPSPRDGVNEQFVDPVKPPMLEVARDKYRQEAEEHRELLLHAKEYLREARRAYKEKDYNRAFKIADDVFRADPTNLEASEMRKLAQGQLDDANERISNIASERRDRSRYLETDEHATAPAPRMPVERPHLASRNDDPSVSRRLKIAEALEQPISVNFMKSELDYVVNTLFLMTGINIIADPSALEGKPITLHVTDLKLREVLDYIVRNNDGLALNITENAVWITANTGTDMQKIMFPRVYPLHYGLVNSEPGNGASSGSGGGGGGGGNGGGRARGNGGGGGGQNAGGANAQEKTYLETALKWMKDAKSAYVLPEGSDYLIDRQSNNLIVHTTPSGHDSVSKFLDFFDQPAIQCLIKTRFLDIQAQSEKSLGINLDSLKANTTRVDAAGRTIVPNTNYTFQGGTNLFATAGTPGASVLTLIGSKTDPTYQLSLAALETSSKTKILSEPQILAINNKQAVIDITTHFSYITDLRPITTTNQGGNGTTVSNVSGYIPEFGEEDIGFTLTVTPSIGRDLKTINLHLNPIIDSLAQGQTISQFSDFSVPTNTTNNNNPPTIKKPTIDQTSLETDVVMEDNGYCIIGGLIRNRTQRDERRIPGLHKIPVIGNIFKSNDETKSKSNLMIIVEANIISPSGRTYYTKTQRDDVDIREGASNHAPGQVSFNKANGNDNFMDGSRRPVPVPASPALAYAQSQENANSKVTGRVERNDEQTKLDRKERMMRLAESARAATPKPVINGWAVAQEEVVTAAAVPTTTRMKSAILIDDAAEIVPLAK